MLDRLGLIDLLCVVTLIDLLRLGSRLIDLSSIASRIGVLLVLQDRHVISHEACLILGQAWINRLRAVCSRSSIRSIVNMVVVVGPQSRLSSHAGFSVKLPPQLLLAKCLHRLD